MMPRSTVLHNNPHGHQRREPGIYVDQNVIVCQDTRAEFGAL